MVKCSKKDKPNKDFIAVVFVTNGVANPRIYIAERRRQRNPLGAKFDGYGGKWQPCDKDIYATAKRKLSEKAGVTVKRKDLSLRGVVEVFYLGNKSKKPDRVIYYFTTFNYNGTLSKTKKMWKPSLYEMLKPPFKDMRPADGHVLQKMDLSAKGKVVKGQVKYMKNNEGVIEVIPHLPYVSHEKIRA